MAPTDMENNGMSEYELQRLRNLEENRRILESIRQEQLYSLEGLLPAKKISSKSSDRPRQGIKRKKATSSVSESSEGLDSTVAEGEGEAELGLGRRRSARLCGKKPRYSLHGDDGQDENDEDFQAADMDESYSDDEENFEDRPGRRRSVRPPGPKGPRPKIIIPKDRPNFYGAVPGIPIGKVWETRMACCADGIHRPTVAGIHGGPEGAYSISLAGGYEDDVDLGDCFTYTGEGGRALKGTKANPKNLRTAPQSKDQTLTKGNLALSLNITSRKPVRVIRGANLNNDFAPEYGYRYDGLYTVEKYWSCVGKSGFKVFKFALRRCQDQPPPPWITGPVPSEELMATTKEEDETEGKSDDNEDNNPQKSDVLKVKLFNK